MGKCNNCNIQIPSTRRKGSLYCSHKCYKEQKSKRDSAIYKQHTSYLNRVKKNEELLRQFYPICSTGEAVPFRYLDALGFDWGLSTGDAHYEGKCLTEIASYAYHLDKSNQTVSIWKLRLKK